jgi:hypothetical protein
MAQQMIFNSGGSEDTVTLEEPLENRELSWMPSVLRGFCL